MSNIFLDNDYNVIVKGSNEFGILGFPGEVESIDNETKLPIKAKELIKTKKFTIIVDFKDNVYFTGEYYTEISKKHQFGFKRFEPYLEISDLKYTCRIIGKFKGIEILLERE